MCYNRVLRPKSSLVGFLRKEADIMQENKKKSFGDDLFWDLSSYKAPKTPVHPRAQRSSGSVSEIEVPRVEPSSKGAYGDSRFSSDGTITRFVSPTQKKPNTDRKLILEYQPKNPFIKQVQIFTDLDSDSVFAKSNLFLRERAALLNRVGREAPHVPFYSMMPRYSQMTRPQLAYYLWWRENIRHGVFLECDISYVILYSHELIVADEDEDKHEILRMLCKLYSAQYKDKQAAYFGIGNLIADFCILHNLSLPDDCLGDKFTEFITYTSLPEFFIDISDRYNPSMHQRLIAGVSVYNYKKSKHYVDNKQLFDTHMRGAVAAIFSDDKAYASLSAFSDTAYGDVLTSHKPFFKLAGMTTKQAKIKISYYPLPFLQSIITDALRYTENKIREHLGIKSKLNVTTVNPDIKGAIDAYADKLCPPISRERLALAAEKKAASEYDKLYDVPKSELSLERALEIEQKSWETTKILIEAFEEDTHPEPEGHIAPTVIQPVEQKPDPTENSSLYESLGLSLGDNAEFLKLCINEDFYGQRRYAKGAGVSADELAEQINSLALEIIGDILLDDMGEGYIILEDYKNLF